MITLPAESTGTRFLGRISCQPKPSLCQQIPSSLSRTRVSARSAYVPFGYWPLAVRDRRITGTFCAEAVGCSCLLIATPGHTVRVFHEKKSADGLAWMLRSFRPVLTVAGVNEDDAGVPESYLGYGAVPRRPPVRASRNGCCGPCPDGAG